jgi:hypothetical protein
MSTFPGSPKLLKGAIVGIDLTIPIPSVIVFQYNPATLTRTLRPRATTGQGATAETLRLQGAPEEDIQIDVEIDATDQLEKGAVPAGIYPQLSALEMLIYPKSAQVITNTMLMSVGTMEVIPPAGPFTLFIWGVKRVLPVRITDFSITEEAHDTALNPIRAKVSLGLRVMNYNDFPVTHPGHFMFLAHQVVKEAMSIVGSVSNLGAVAGGNIKLI